MTKCVSIKGWWMAGALAALVATGCSGNGGEGGSGGTGGTTSSGGTGGATGGTGGTGGATGGAGGAPACTAADLNLFQVITDLYEGGGAAAGDFQGSVSGTVSEVGSGPLPQACAEAEAGTNGAWASLLDENGALWTACYTGEGASMPVTQGQQVTFDRVYLKGYFSKASSVLTVRAGEQLVALAMAQGRDPLDWTAEIALTDGDLLCFTDGGGSCGDEAYEMVAALGGDEVRLKPGETGTLGSYEVHAGRWQHYVDGGGCDAGQFDRGAFAFVTP